MYAIPQNVDMKFIFFVLKYVVYIIKATWSRCFSIHIYSNFIGSIVAHVALKM